MPFFSIIIPVYNVAPYLRECLDSVLAQTFANWEAICVDDGSTDGSGEILDGYAAKDTRFRVIHQANAGVSAARNKALDNAQGEWIGFLDADDLFEKDWLEKISLSAKPDVDWIRTGWTDWNEKGQIANSARKHIGLKDSAEEFFDETVLLVIGWQLISRCGFPFVNYYRREIIGDISYPVGIRFREDAIFGYEMVLRTGKLTFAEVTGYVRRERDGSATLSCRRRDDTIKLLSQYVELWKRAMPAIGEGIILERVVEASTFWVRKDVREWFTQCPSRTFHDAFKVWRALRKLRRLGAVSTQCDGTLFDNLRWKMYLATGIGRILFVTRLNLLGTIPSGEGNR